jgi:hypothetical protein
VVGALLLVAWAAVTGWDLLIHGRSLQAHLQALDQAVQAVPEDSPLASDLGSATGLDLATVEGAGAHLAGMHSDLVVIQGRVGSLLPAGRLLGWVPRYGGDLAAAPDLLQVASGVTAAADRVFQALSPALGLLEAQGDAGPGLELGAELLPVLAAARPELEAAQQDLAAVARARDRIEEGTLSPRVAGLLARLDRYLPGLEAAVDGALLAPELLGAEGPRTYLVLAQNNHELRPTGGFISGVGELQVEKGRLLSLDFQDSYAVDNLAVPHDVPPADFQQVLWGEIWLFRDTNWDPDFPTSAARALEVYARDRGVRAQGVVALDLSALALLLQALGPVEVEGIPEPVTGDNVLQVLQAQWANPTAGPEFEAAWDREWWTHRKDFMGQVADAALDKLLAGGQVAPLALAQALVQGLEEKHILISLPDPAAARLLRARNWDGGLPEPWGLSDLLAVVDANVGFNKVDPNVSRSIRYQVDLAAGEGPRATLALTYQNHSTRHVEVCIQEARYGDAYADMMDRCYWDYVRVYGPLGSRLLAGPAAELPPGSLLARNGGAEASPLHPTISAGNWAAWTAFFALAPGTERTLTFEVALPVGVLHTDAGGRTHYRLQVQKQPGTEATPLYLEVRLPPGAELVDASPAGLFSLRSASVMGESDLRTDRVFEFVFQEESKDSSQ